MILKDYEKLPEKMKNEKVKEYYDIISKKKISLVMKRIFDIFFSLVLLIILSPILLILAILIKIQQMEKYLEYLSSEQWYKMQTK